MKTRTLTSSICLAVLTLLGFTGRTHAEQVIFSEVMYNSSGNRPEYIEVQNLTATPFDIAGWKLRGGVDFDFPAFLAASPAASFLKPGERIVLSSADSASTRSAYSIPATVRIFGPWSGNLSDSGEEIILRDKNGVGVCALSYGDSGKWPTSADGTGHSLVLKNPNRTVNDWRNWAASSRPGGTPGTDPVISPETPVANPEINSGQGSNYVDLGSRWKFHDQNLNLGSAWYATNYSDSAWSEGPGLLGFETAALPAPGIRQALQNFNQLTYYLRTYFVYNGSLNGAVLTLDQVLDDGAVYYLNGQLIGQSGVAPGASGFSVPANRNVTDATEEFNIFPINSGALRQGTNVLAVELHQVNTNSSDLVFGARLKISVPSQSPSVLINEVLAAGPGAGFVEFFNPSAGSSLNLNGYYLSDTPANLLKFRIDNNLVLSPSGFQSVGFTESSLALTNPVTVYLTAPNGTSVVSAIRTTIPLDGRSLGRKPAGSQAWYLFNEPTRDAANQSQESALAGLRLSEVQFSTNNTVAWVEVANLSSNSVVGSNVFLSARRDFTDKVALSGTLSAGGLASQNVSFPVSGSDLTLYLVTATGVVLDSRDFELGTNRNHQVFPVGSAEWFSGDVATRNGPNNPVRNLDVIINEVMYNPPSDEIWGEFIELYNRGTTAQDLSNWSLDDATDFRFPPGTSLAPGAYLVVAADADRLRAAHGDIPVIGNFNGRLGNRGDRIGLLDATGNLADQVDYRVGGDWPFWADGGGSSMELINPRMDNSLSSAWADSDETNKAAMRPYSFSAVYQQLDTGSFAVTAYRELFFHLVGDGHIVLENIQLRANGTGPNMLTNSTVLATNGSGASGWLAQGTHWASFVENGRLHIVSDGRGDNRVNRVEVDAPGLTPGVSVTLSFNARWVSGNPRLIGQTWDHSVCGSFRIFVPENLGTPGASNSRFRPGPPPEVEGLIHSPAVPRTTNVVTITAKVSSADPLASVILWHRRDNVAGNGIWSSKPMFDDGLSAGDLVAGDGLFSGQLTEHQANSAVVQFYVQANSANGQASVQPRGGSNKPALYVVDDRNLARDLHLKRFVISAYDVAAIANGSTAAHQYRFPRMANHYFNATYIADEREIYYNAELHNAGSPWTRDGSLNRGKWKLPKDRLFRGREKFTYDNDPTANRRHHNRIVRYWLYLLGHAVNENEFIRVVVNAGSADIREDTEHVANDFLNRNFQDGSSGDLYQIEDSFWFADDNATRSNRDADWTYRGSDNSGHIRTPFAKRTMEVDDDFTALIGLFRLITANNYTQGDIGRVLDAEAALKMAAVRGYVGDWDSFTLDRGKNMFIYRRADDGLFQFLHWDSDLAFRSGQALYGSRVSSWITKPFNRRLFFSYLAEMLQNYTRNSPRMEAWLLAEEDANASFPVDATFYRTWFSDRESYVRMQMGTNYTRPFEITSNAGNAFTTNAQTISLTGNAPYGVFAIQVPGHPEARLTWTSEVGWTISGLQLRNGTNLISLQAVNDSGVVVRQDSISITKTGDSFPVMALKASPSWRAAVNESVRLDPSDSFDPENSPLTFNWSVDLPASARITTNLNGTIDTFSTRPGWYEYTVVGRDAAGLSTPLRREVTVYGGGGFSSFNNSPLEPFWNYRNADYRNNTPVGAYFTLEEVGGGLRLQIPGDTTYWLTNASAPYPWIFRNIPSSTDWSLQTEVDLDTRQFGNFMTGLQIEAVEGGVTNRYAFGIENGNLYSGKRVSPGGIVNSLFSVPCTNGQDSVRFRRQGNALIFQRRAADVWLNLHTNLLAAATATTRGGIFLATSAAQAIKVQFNNALLVDPSDTSPLREFLRVSEVMYNPLGGVNYEFVELINIGTQMLTLDGARFTNGITYTFGSQSLAPGQRIVVAKDRATFIFRYSTNGILLAAGGFTGQLDNGGESLILVDASTNLILEFSYGDSGDWPEKADGYGASLELVNLTGDVNDPDTWRSSREFHGSPGRAGTGPLPQVVINEILTHTDPPLEDAIELHNLTDAPVALGGWFLTDDLTVPKKYRIATGMTIPANGFIVFYETDFATNNLLVPFSLSSAQGDRVYLLAADASGNLTAFVDDIQVGPSLNGVSFGRYPNGTGRMVSMSERTFGRDQPSSNADFREGGGLTNSHPRVGPVVISEFLYAPVNGGDEYLELSNITSTNVPLFDPSALTNTWKLQGAVSFTFPQNVTIPVGGKLLVVGIDPALFRTAQAIPPEIPIYGPYLGALDNAGETIELYQPDAPETQAPNPGLVPYVLVEEVEYDDALPWPPLAAQGGAPLFRQVLTNYANDASNWGTEEPNTTRDRDGDGMADDWELVHGLNPDLAADGPADPDGDGLSNVDEYRAGTNPRSAASTLRMEMVSLGGQDLLLRFGGVADRSYSIFYRDNLGSAVWISWASTPARGSNFVWEATNNAAAANERYFRVTTPVVP